MPTSLCTPSLSAAASIFLTLVVTPSPCPAQEREPFAELGETWAGAVRPLVQRYCVRCHSTAKPKGDLDLKRFGTLTDVRRGAAVWQSVHEMLEAGEMPPSSTRRQPTPEERATIIAWARALVSAEARTRAGDPGRVVLRRLSNAEYDYSVLDLTGVDLRPTRMFPVDGAAGEGFTNTGDALVMSASLLDKYLGAAKRMAAHAVPLPDGLRFSEHATRRDWTDEVLAEIRAVYARHADARGRVDLRRYVELMADCREDLRQGTTSPEEAARAVGLNPRYLRRLWITMEGREISPVLDSVRARWRGADPGRVRDVLAPVAAWQKRLWKFGKVGHVGAWQQPADPLATTRTLRFELSVPAGRAETVVYLAAFDAGDGNEHDWVEWRRPRLVAAGKPPLLLRDVEVVRRRLDAAMRGVLGRTASYLEAAAEVARRGRVPEVVARERRMSAEVLDRWLTFLGVVSSALPGPGDYFSNQRIAVGGNPKVNGWGPPRTPNLVANASDEAVMVPGRIEPHRVTVHPSPTEAAGIGWKSPLSGDVRVELAIADAHHDCGNGAGWTLEHAGGARQVLASGTYDRGKRATIPVVERVAVLEGEMISVLVDARGKDHGCDRTAVDLTITELGGEGRTWHLATDVADDILKGNPHADARGVPGIWHFYRRKVGAKPKSDIPVGSVLAMWLSAAAREETKPDELATLAAAVQDVLTGDPPATGPDAELFRGLRRFGGPLFAAGELAARATPDLDGRERAAALGLSTVAFGVHPSGAAVDEASLVVRAPEVLAVRLPASLAAGRTLVVDAMLADPAHGSASAQVHVGDAETAPKPGLIDAPVLVRPGSPAATLHARACAEFRAVFPAAVCFAQVVPTDEVVTLRMFHREDEHLVRLFLDENERTALDRHWEELRYISQDAIKIHESFDLFQEFKGQIGQREKFEPQRVPIRERRDAFLRELAASEPAHLDAVLELAARAWRRPLEGAERSRLTELYRSTRAQDKDHDTALRTMLTAILVSPHFLYKVERPAPGQQARPVSDFELATRLSAFLWSSIPDTELLELAAAGQLRNPKVLAAQTSRMLRDPRLRRFATEFGAQWLHVRDIAERMEKNEKLYPDFDNELAGVFTEETVRFIEDLVRRDGSLLELLEADHTFLNERLARHYGIPGVEGARWRRVDGVREHARGGLLTMASVLATQSGASRTSPILRGTFVLETLLGQRVPNPPADVPELPDRPDDGALSVRELTERHRSDPACMRCHQKIDPYGFALERFDALGRLRDRDAGGRPIDVRVELPGGVAFEGVAGLRGHLLGAGRDRFLRTFARKLLGYALGREVVLSDQPLLDTMLSELAANGHRVSALFRSIVASQQFRYHRGREAPDRDDR